MAASSCPGAVGFRAEDRADGPVVNLSYWVFPAFPALKEAAPEAGLGRRARDRPETARAEPHRRQPAAERVDGARRREACAGQGLRAEFLPTMRSASRSTSRGPARATARIWRPSWRCGRRQGGDPRRQRQERPQARGRWAAPATRRSPRWSPAPWRGRRLPEALRKPVPPTFYYPSALQALTLVAAEEAHSGCR